MKFVGITSLEWIYKWAPRTQLTTYAWEAYRKGAVKRYQVLEGSSAKYDLMCFTRSKATSIGNTTEATASDLRPLILLVFAKSWSVLNEIYHDIPALFLHGNMKRI